MDEKIVYVRLISGEELIGVHFRTDENTFGFKKLIQLHVGPPQSSNSQSPTLAFGAWIPYTKSMEKVDINRNCVLLMSDPIDEIRLAYQKITGQIITPQKGFILPT